MKKFMVTVVVTGLIGGAAFAQTNVVSSANVVGYNSIDLPSNQLVLAATSFLSTNNTVAGLFANLPTGTKVSLWNSAGQAYNAVTKGRSGWGTAGTNQIVRGSGVFISLPTGTATTNVYMSGDVPVDSTSQVYKVNGLALLAYPYPADVAFTNTTLAKNALTGDKVSFWNNGWVAYTKGRSGWGTASNVQLQVGQAFFYQSTTKVTVNEIQPYTIN